MTGPQGLWSATNLPPVPIEALAVHLRLRGEAQAEHLDAQAVTVPYPRPAAVTLRAVE